MWSWLNAHGFFTTKDVLQILGPYLGACATFSAAVIALFVAFRRESYKVNTRIEYTGEDKWTMKVTITNWSEFPVFVEGTYFKYRLPNAGAPTSFLNIWDNGEEAYKLETGESDVRQWRQGELIPYLKYEIGKWRVLPCGILCRTLRVGVKLKGSGKVHFSRMDVRTAARITEAVKKFKLPER